MTTTLEPDVSTCIGCGCDDRHACDGGCWWIRLERAARLGVCSECEARAEAWDLGDRTIRATPAAELDAIAAGELRIPRPEQPRPDGIVVGGCREITAGGITVHVQLTTECPHDWPFEDLRDTDQCRWCGMTFIRHVFTEMP